MSLLTVVQGVCAVVGVNMPASVFTGLNSNRTMQEMLALANDMATRIAYDEREWSALKSLATFSGDAAGSNLGTSSRFALPADYKRMLVTANVWRSTSSLFPMVFINNTDLWTQRRNQGIYDARGEWAIHAGWFNVAPPLQAGGKPPAGVTAPAWQQNHLYHVNDYALDVESTLVWKCLIEHISPPGGTFGDYRALYPNIWGLVTTPPQTAQFNYLIKNPIALASGGLNDAFISDNDTFVLPERLLRLGMIWQWKANKGTAYAEDMANYQNALSVEAGADKPAPILIGTMPVSAAARVAYPFPITVGGQTI